MPESTHYKWGFPEEDTDPWFDDHSDFINRVDASTFALQASCANILIPANNIAWQFFYGPNYGRLTWDDDFQVPILGSGFFLNISFGPDGQNRFMDLFDGDRVIITIPRTSTGNVLAGKFEISKSKLDARDGLFTVGFSKNNKFYANFPQIFT